MSQGQLPGVFGDVQPLLEHYGYLAVGGFVLLEDFAGEHIGAIYDGFERYKWYVIGAAALLIVGSVVHRVRRRRAWMPEKT